MITKLTFGCVALGAIFGTIAFLGFSPFGKQVIQEFGSTTQGATGSIARQYNVYGVNLAAPGANATSSSLFNATGQDLYTTTVKVGCENVGTSKAAYTGGGLAALQMTVGTSSSAAPAAAPTNALLAGAVNIGTSTPYFVMASSTNGAISATGIAVWPAGSYMTFWFNATNTAVCTVGVDAFTS